MRPLLRIRGFFYSARAHANFCSWRLTVHSSAQTLRSNQRLVSPCVVLCLPCRLAVKVVQLVLLCLAILLRRRQDHHLHACMRDLDSPPCAVAFVHSLRRPVLVRTCVIVYTLILWSRPVATTSTLRRRYATLPLMVSASDLHSYSELGPATSSDSCGDSTPEPSYFVRAAASRNISSVSTEPDVTGSQSPVQGSSPVHSSIGSSSVPEDSSESVQREYRQSPMPRVCYEAPAKQRTAFRHRPRAATPSAPAFVVPSSFHYVAQMEKRKYYEHSQAPLLPTPMTPHPMMAYQHAGGAQMMFQPVAYPYGPHGATALVYTPIMYHNMGGAPNNVVYED